MVANLLTADIPPEKLSQINKLAAPAIECVQEKSKTLEKLKIPNIDMQIATNTILKACASEISELRTNMNKVLGPETTREILERIRNKLPQLLFKRWKDNEPDKGSL